MIYTILDIETTGLSRNHDQILEVGYMQVNRVCSILRHGAFYFYKPEWIIENQAQSVHQLYRSFLSEKCPDDNTFMENLATLYTLCEQGVLIGKNSGKFDIPFIESFLNRHAIGLPDFKLRGALDLQNAYAPRYKEYYARKNGVATRKQGTLEELIEMIGYTQGDIKDGYEDMCGADDRARAHGALYDAYMTYQLLKYAIVNYGLKI